MALPDGFKWRHDATYGHWWLVRIADEVAVVCVSERVTKDGWVVTVERHLWPVRSFIAPTFGRANAWAEAWARVHAHRLLVEPKEPFGG